MKYIAISLFLLTILSFSLFVMYTPPFHAQCYGKTTQETDDYRFESLIKLNMNANKGHLTLTGMEGGKGGPVAHISREINFNYTTNGHYISVISTSINIDGHDTINHETQKLFLADFFLRKGRGITVEWKKNGDQSLVFIIDGIPQLYCINDFLPTKNKFLNKKIIQAITSFNQLTQRSF